MFWLHIFTHTMCLSASQEGQNKALNSLELELLVAVNSHMDAWNWTWDLCRIKKHSSPMSHLHAWLWTSRELNFKVETCYLYYQVNLRLYRHEWKVMVVKRWICVSGSSMMLTFVNLTIARVTWKVSLNEESSYIVLACGYVCGELSQLIKLIREDSD